MPHIREREKGYTEKRKKFLAPASFKWTQSRAYTHFCVLSWAKHFMTLYDWWNASMLRPAEMSSWKKSAPNTRNSYHPWSSLHQVHSQMIYTPRFLEKHCATYWQLYGFVFYGLKAIVCFCPDTFPSFTSKVSLIVLKSLKRTLLSALPCVFTKYLMLVEMRWDQVSACHY